jgi:hypothetical protein
MISKYGDLDIRMVAQAQACDADLPETARWNPWNLLALWMHDHSDAGPAI